MPNTIEPSKSSRASCRGCKEKIMKGVLRFGLESIFKRGDDEYTSFKWYHIDCAINKLPEEVLTAEINAVLSKEIEDKIAALKKKEQKTAVSVLPFTDIDQPDKVVNIEGIIRRAMREKKAENAEGELMRSRTVFVQMNEDNGKIVLWGDHCDGEMDKDDRLVLLKAKSFLGSNDAIQFSAEKDTVVLVNPKDEEISDEVGTVEFFVAEGWERPSGKKVEFAYAPSSRARCVICNEKILKGELKIVKPEFMKNENTGASYAGNRSFHPKCAKDDIHGIEILHEAVTRLDNDTITDNHQTLQDLYDSLPDMKAKEILATLLNLG